MGDEKTKTSRGWCFTLNNWTVEDRKACEAVDSKYTIFGEEVGEKGTPHLQGYFYMRSATSMKSMTKKVPRASFRAAKGTDEENTKYCSKEGVNLFTKGKAPMMGERKDIDEIKDIIDDGGNLLDCFNGNFGLTVRCYKGFERYMECIGRPGGVARRDKDSPWKVIWIWGKAGKGKSRIVYDKYHEDDIYTKPIEWYNGYMGQKVMLIDDFDEKTMGNKELLHLMDRYPMMGKTKGSFVNINSEVLYITSDFHPSEFWRKGNELDQITRRITEIIEVSVENQQR